MVVAQLALALVLGVGASLLFNSFMRVRAVDPGFRPDQLMVFAMPMKRPDGWNQAMWQDWDELLNHVRAIPGVDSVDAGSNLPFQGPNWGPRVLLPGDPPEFDRSGIAGYVVTMDFFGTMGIPLIRGRSFGSEDGPDGARAVVVNEEFECIWTAGSPWDLRFGLAVRKRPTSKSSGSWAMSFRPEPRKGPCRRFTCRTRKGIGRSHALPFEAIGTAESLAGDLRRAASLFSSLVPVQDLGPIRSRIGAVRTEPRFNAMLLGSFASVALLLAGVGLYGTMAHSVGMRTRELGIRQALGADRTEIFRMVLREGLVVSGAGLLAGFAGALLLTRFLERFLFGVGTMDIPTFLAAAAVLSIVILLAMIRSRAASHASGSAGELAGGVGDGQSRLSGGNQPPIKSSR